MYLILCIGLLLPLIGFLTILLTSPWIGKKQTSFLACTTIFLSFCCFLALLIQYLFNGMHSFSFTLFQWISLKTVQVNVSFSLDSLALLMTMIITGIGFLIHLFSVGYMEHEEDFARYFACMNFFVFSMLLLVLAENMLLLFIGWEGVGLASYLLIGFWYHRPSAAAAAQKAFIVNRIGDLGFLLALLLSFSLFGTVSMGEMTHKMNQYAPDGIPTLTLLTLLYFVGATGKSAQIPLHTWLPDAMEGPTPVSALIHAATMVTAGVYLVVRLSALFALTPFSLYIVGFVGAVTALFAALCATSQTDLKRVLAYSTISQLGLMFLACGVGAYYAALFHLTTHAFVKGLLFLSAGNVVHMMQGTTNMERMGGLSNQLPKTRWLFLIGVFAMSGIPPLACFFSKDLILEQVSSEGYLLLFLLGLIASILTAYYLTRAYLLTFQGKPNLEPHILKTIKEAPSIMLLPVMALALLSAFGGIFLSISVGNKQLLENFLVQSGISDPLSLPIHEMFLSPITWLSLLGSILGILAGYLIYRYFADSLNFSILFFKNGFLINEFYDRAVVYPLNRLSQSISDTVEPLFNKMVGNSARLTDSISQIFQKMQNGQLRSYVAVMTIGMAGLIFYFIFL